MPNNAQYIKLKKKPIDGAIIEKSNEYLKIKGYAFSGGGKYIDNVLVSVDGGITWLSSTVNQFDRPYNQLFFIK